MPIATFFEIAGGISHEQPTRQEVRDEGYEAASDLSTTIVLLGHLIPRQQSDLGRGRIRPKLQRLSSGALLDTISI